MPNENTKITVAEVKALEAQAALKDDAQAIREQLAFEELVERYGED